MYKSTWINSPQRSPRSRISTSSPLMLVLLGRGLDVKQRSLEPPLMQGYFCFWSKKWISGLRALNTKSSSIEEGRHFISLSVNVGMLCGDLPEGGRVELSLPHCISSAPAFPIGLRLIVLIFSIGGINSLSISDLSDHRKAVNLSRSNSTVLLPLHAGSWLF